ncbi:MULTISPECIES: hypothetical protein [Sphingobium]|nr:MULTISPECIES: hypothetical protein [Sphingobium]WQE07156.1 hypothetical protein U0025_23290 [Sphingobium yanoikuyae]
MKGFDFNGWDMFFDIVCSMANYMIRDELRFIGVDWMVRMAHSS